MSSCHRFCARLIQVPAVLFAFLSLTACSVNLEDFDETSRFGVLVIGTAFDSGNVAVSQGYDLKFRTFDREIGRMGRQSAEPDGFVISRDFEDTEAAVAAGIFGLTSHREDFSEVKYHVVELKPAEYVLFTATQPDIGAVFITCFKPPVPSFEIVAGQITYVGNIIFETGQGLGFYTIKELARDDDGARAAVAQSGGDPSKMQWRGFGRADFKHKECPKRHYR